MTLLSTLITLSAPKMVGVTCAIYFGLVLLGIFLEPKDKDQ